MKVQIPRFITLILAIATIVVFFLPMMKTNQYTESVIDATAEIAEELQIETTTEVGGLSLKDLKSISLFKLTTMSFSEAGISGDADNDRLAGGVFASVGAISILIALFALCKRPILTLLFDLIGLGAFAMNSYVIEEGLKSTIGYEWGIAHSLYLPLYILIIIGAIWMLIAKRSDKKAARLRQARARS